jgi:hypothetical protein
MNVKLKLSASLNRDAAHQYGQFQQAIESFEQAAKTEE